MKVEIEIQPFTIPNYVILKIPGDSNTRTEGAKTLPLKELSSETLDKLCEDFKSEVFKKAGKGFLPECGS